MKSCSRDIQGDKYHSRMSILLQTKIPHEVWRSTISKTSLSNIRGGFMIRNAILIESLKEVS